MPENTSPALMAAEVCSNKHTLRDGYETQSYVAVEMALDLLRTIVFSEFHSFSLRPEAKDFIVIIESHRPDMIVHILIASLSFEVRR
jgi:hypothetical protein